MSKGHPEIIMYFVPKSKIRQALVDMQNSYGSCNSWIQSCDYMADDNKFAVQVAMTMHYPYQVNEWKKWEQE